MKQKILLLLLLFISATGAMAQRTLNVYQRDGTLICFAFSEKPIARFVVDDVIIKTDRQSVSFPFSCIEKYTFEDGLAPVGMIAVHASESQIVNVFSIDGRLVKSIKVGEVLQADVITVDLPSGTYIIKSNNVTYKYQKK